MIALPPQALQRLRAGLSGLLPGAGPTPSRSRVQAQVPALLVEALGAADGVTDVPSGARVRLVREAMDLIHQNGQVALSVGDLCHLLGVTERSLQRGFREVSGVSPKQFLLAHRLNGVHRSLRSAAPGRTLVADVANEWGFWHMGQMAADYRRHFGEKPSETLRRRPHGR